MVPKTLAGNPLRASLLVLRETLQACFVKRRLISELGEKTFCNTVLGPVFQTIAVRHCVVQPVPKLYWVLNLCSTIMSFYWSDLFLGSSYWKLVHVDIQIFNFRPMRYTAYLANHFLVLKTVESKSDPRNELCRVVRRLPSSKMKTTALIIAVMVLQVTLGSV